MEVVVVNTPADEKKVVTTVVKNLCTPGTYLPIRVVYGYSYNNEILTLRAYQNDGTLYTGNISALVSCWRPTTPTPPVTGSYVVATPSALSDERILTAGTGITVTDGGPGGNITVANSGIIAVSAGAGISVTPGNPTLISNTGVLALTAGTNISITGTNANLTINSTVTPTTPGGSDTQVQFNDAGAFGGDSAFVWDKTNNFLGVGGTIPTARLHLSGAQSALAWTTNGIALRVQASTYTDTSSSGTVANTVISNFETPTLAATNPTTYSLASTLYIQNAPQAGSNVTLSDSYAIHVDNGNVRFDGGIAAGGFGIGTTGAKYNFGIGHSLPAVSWGISGIGLRLNTGTVTDTSTLNGATVTTAHIHSILRPTLAATNATSGITYTTSATLYVQNSPLPGTNVSITTPLALMVGAGDVLFNGSLAIGASAASNTELFQLNGNMTKAAWTTNGIRFRAVGRTYTDTSSSGTVATVVVDAFQRPTIAASNATTYTTAATLTITNSPVAGSNVTITNPLSFLIDDGNSRFDGKLIVNSNSNNPTAAFSVLNAGVTANAWGVAGIWGRFTTGIATDDSTADGATVTNAVFYSFGIGTLQATNAATNITYTNAANIYIVGGPTTGTNITFTNKYALWVDADNTRLDGFLQVNGSTAPTSQVDIGGASVSPVVIGATGVGLKHRGNQFTDTTTGAGTVALGNVHSFGSCTFNTTNAITYTAASTLYIANAALAGSNVTITNPWAILVDAGNVRLDGALLVGSLATLISSTDLQVTQATGAIVTFGRNDSSVTANDSLAKIRFFSNDTSTTTNPYAAEIEVIAQATVTTDINPGIMIFKTTPTGVGAALTESFRITETQDLTFVEGVDFNFGTATGTKLGTATTQKLSFWNVTPIVQPTTAISASTFVANTSGIVNDTATFDGYTIGQIVKALRNIGLLQ